MNHELQKRLRDAYCRPPRKPRNIKLPSRLGVETDGPGLRLRLNAASVVQNMQTDDAAFEAWALSLRLWLGEHDVPHVVLDWEPPTDVNNGHYQRFLYRVHTFRGLFPEWFRVADERKLADCAAVTAPRPLLNVPSARSITSGWRTTSREYGLEMALAQPGPERDSFCEYFGLVPDLVDRQFPVGLFRDRVSAKTRIFTGGKSAIDIVGVGKDNRFCIFELKADRNDKAGILSELLLYTSLIGEAAHAHRRIAFPDQTTPTNGVCVTGDHVRECAGIHAVMLVQKLHPLLMHPELLPMLNRAADAHWNQVPGAKPVSFSIALVGKNGSENSWRIRDFDPASEAQV